ncbi:MAG: AAA family ATPase [Myxococcota bacterium]
MTRPSPQSDEQTKLEARVAKSYLESSDWNGLPVARLLGSYAAEDRVAALECLHRAVLAGRLSLTTGTPHPNPHIKAFKPLEPPEQIASCRATEFRHCCVYPERPVLEPMVDRQSYEGRPFSLRLALGDPQLDFVFFRVEILDFYRADPRLRYDFNDISGSICVADEYYDPENSDGPYLQSFGLAWDDDLLPGITTFLYQLARMAPSQQQLWSSQLDDRALRPHSEFYRSNILGEFPRYISHFDALLQEMVHINKLAALMGRPKLFRHDFDSFQRPRRFGYLLRPTRAGYDAFILLLDKLMSDNLNKKFFGTDISDREDVETKNGTEVRHKGTIQMLEEWLRMKVQPSPPEAFDAIFDAFRRVRKARQRPAHSIVEDAYDITLFRQQSQLMQHAWTAVRNIRVAFQGHPATAEYEVGAFGAADRVWPL